MREAHIPIPERVGPANGQVRVESSRARLELRTVGIHRERQAEPAGGSGKRPLAEQRHEKDVDRSPALDQREVEHRLPQLLLAIRALHQIRLVDDVHQVLRFGDAPENLPEACPELPAPGHQLPTEHAHVEVRPVSILRVESEERLEQEGLATVVPLHEVLRPESDRERRAALSVLERRARKEPALHLQFGRQLARHLCRQAVGVQPGRAERHHEADQAAYPVARHRSHRFAEAPLKPWPGGAVFPYGDPPTRRSPGGA